MGRHGMPEAIACRAAARGTYDAAVLDMLMPGKRRASTLLGHPRSTAQHQVRLVVLTSLIQPAMRSGRGDAGFTAYRPNRSRHDQLPAVCAWSSGSSTRQRPAAAATDESSHFADAHHAPHIDRTIPVRGIRGWQKTTWSIRNLPVRILDRLGYQPDVVSQWPGSAVTAFEQNPYATIVMDCQMPTMDGCKPQEAHPGASG